MKKYNIITQGVLLVISITLIVMSWNIVPQKLENAMVGLMIASSLFFIIQLLRKIPETLVFLLVIGWTLMVIFNWPKPTGNPALQVDWKPIIGSILLSAQGWMMFVYNKSRW